MKDKAQAGPQRVEKLQNLRSRMADLVAGETGTDMPPIPEELIGKWQRLVDLMAKVINVPAGLIMRVDPTQIEVFISSRTEGNPYEKGERADLNTGLYCETVMAKRGALLVPDAMKDPDWDHNPDIKLGMISYLGFPLQWPGGEMFGTICVLDREENAYSDLHKNLMTEFSETVNTDLELVAYSAERERLTRELTKARDNLESTVELRTQELSDTCGALRESEEQVRLLLDSAAEAIYGLDLEGNCTFCNSACLKMLGYETSGQLLGKRLHELMHHTRPDGTPYPAEECHIYEAFQRGEGTHVSDEVFWRADGTSFEAEYWSYPIHRTGEVVGSVVTFLDITERKQAEEALRIERDNLRNVFQTMEDGVYIVDQKEDIQYANRVLVEEFGPYEGRKCYEYFHDRDEVCPWCKNSEVVAGNTVHWEWQSSKNGKTYDLMDTPLTLPDGSVGKLEILRDISEQKQASKQLQQLQTELAHAGRLNILGELASGLAHELNQPLACVNVYAQTCAELLSSNKASRSDVCEPLEEISKETMRAANIVKRLRNFGRKRSRHQSTVDVNQLVREVVPLFRHESNNRGIDIRLSLANGLPLVLADSIQIQQVVSNLLLNAIQAIDESGVSQREVSVRTAMDPDGHVRIAVHDTGPGLPDGLADQVFDSFYTTKPEGMGLGLSISRTIVEDHEGRLWATSDEKHGTEFTFTLPRNIEGRHQDA